MSILNMVLPGGGGGGFQLGTLSSDKTNIELTYSASSSTFTIDYNGDGNIEIENSNEDVVSVELVSGTTYRVIALDDGNAVLTISATPTENYFTPDTLEITVSAELLPSASNILNDNSWEVISAISQAGLADSYWNVGDRKAITLNGTVGGNLTLSNTTLYVFILGFDHNGSSGITFGGFKTALTSGTDVALIDSGYGSSQTSGTWFNMYNTNSNAGGWAKSRMRYYVLGSTDSSSGSDASSTTATNPVSNTLMAALPSELRNVMKSMTIYSDNRSSSSTNVTATVDYLPLLAEYEVFGSTSYAASAEASHQAQYKYYQNGNSKVKYRHSSTGSTCRWWLRSTNADHTGDCCRVGTYGTVTSYSAYYSYGVAPAFLV